MNTDHHTLAVLETKRLILKEITPGFWDYAFRNWSDDELKNTFGYTAENLPVEKEKHRLGLLNYHISFKNFVMITKDTNTVLGRIGYHTWYVRHHRAEIGYGIEDKAQRGKGYISEALKPLLAYGFEKMGLYRTEALTAPDNIASIKVLQNHGFLLEGVLRGHYYINGEQSDSNCYSLLKDEYEKLKHNWQ